MRDFACFHVGCDEPQALRSAIVPLQSLRRRICIVDADLARGDEAVAEVLAERSALYAAFDWSPLAQHKW